MPESLETLTLEGSPYCAIIIGDSRYVMRQLPQQSIDLIFADPPFNQGEPYSTWKDTLPGAEYAKFTREWLDGARGLLTGKGTLWVNCPDELAARVVVYCEDALGLTLANWCLWHYRFGQWRDGGFIRSKTHALRFVVDPEKAIWNADAVLVTSDRRGKYKDARTEATERPGQRVPLDLWGVPSDGEGFCAAAGIADAWGIPADGMFWGRVQGNNAERWGKHPNQLPEKYVERAMRSCSNPESVIFTPFVGSGTELVVSRALGRMCYGVEIGRQEALSAFARVKRGSVRVTK